MEFEGRVKKRPYSSRGLSSWESAGDGFQSRRGVGIEVVVVDGRFTPSLCFGDAGRCLESRSRCTRRRSSFRLAELRSGRRVDVSGSGPRRLGFLPCGETLLWHVQSRQVRRFAQAEILVHNRVCPHNLHKLDLRREWTNDSGLRTPRFGDMLVVHGEGAMVCVRKIMGTACKLRHR
jgi:hypothetical protein